MKSGPIAIRLLLSVALAVALAACGGSKSSSSSSTPEPTPNYAAATNTANIPSGDSTCPYGGITVETGVDKNGNGILDASEVQNTQKVCNGAPGGTGATGSTGTKAVVATTAEAAGANCAAGGIKIQVGLDDGLPSGTANNGILETGEVDQTSYACNGGPVVSLAQSALTATMLSASVGTDGKPVVTFTVTDQNGLSVANLTTSSARFDIAKLVAASSGNASRWQNYIYRIESNSGANAIGTTASDTQTVQANTENTGTLTYSAGVFTYKFATAISPTRTVTYTGTAPINTVDLTYDPTLTHRVSMQISGGTLPTGVVANATYDFVPAGGSVTTTREIVKTDTCNQCHDKLALHGGGRVEVKYCVTCHNPGTVDANSGNTVDMKVFIHRIHFGSNLPSVIPVAQGGNATKYEIWGYNASEHDYSGGVFPQMIPSKRLLVAGVTSAPSMFPTCTKCHVAADAVAPNADNWKTAPTKEACASCHDNVVFDGTTPAAWQVAHTGGTQTNNSLCTSCHASGGTYGADTVHSYPNSLATESAKYQFIIESFAYDGTTGIATIGFSAKNPTTTPYTTPFTICAGCYYNMGDSSATSPFIMTTDTTNGSTSTSTISAKTASVTVYLGWSATEHTNAGNGSTSTPASAQSKSVIARPAVLTSNASCGTTTACTFSTTITLNAEAKAAAAAAGSFVVSIGGRIKSPVTNYSPALAAATNAAVTGTTYLSSVPVAAAVKYYNTAGTALTATTATRRVVATATNCNSCHAQVQAHGGARADNVQLCVICHNPNNTDVSNRSIDAPSLALDGKKEQAVDFKVMIHGIHAGPKRVNPFMVNTVSFAEVEFPGKLSNCTNCHTTAGYTLPISTAALGTTTNSNPAAATVLAARAKTFGTLSFSQGTTFAWTQLPAPTSPIDLTPVTGGAITITNHGLVTGDTVTLSVSGTATLPTGFLAATPYTATVVDNSHFTLASGGTKVIPTALGVGSVSISVPTSVDTITNNRIQFANHGLATGQVVQFSAAKYGLSTLTDYFVVNAATNTFQVSTTSGGAAFTLLADSGCSATPPACAAQTVVPKAIMDPSDNGRTSPTASVCSTCHDDTLSVAHMKLQGAGFTSATGAVANPVKYDVNGNLVDNTTTYVETCAVCHGTGAVVDVATVHHGQ